MKARVLVTSLAASPAIDVCRCLRRDPEVTIVGADASAEGQALAGHLAHEIVSLPIARQQPEEYALALAAAAQSCDFLFVCLDEEIEALARVGSYPKVAHALAPIEVARLLLDKHATLEASGRPGLFPKSCLLVEPRDVASAIQEVGGDAWLRPTTGTSGCASLHVQDPVEAEAWLTLWQKRVPAGTRWIVHEYLPGRNLNFTGLFQHGELVSWGQMLRQQYYLANVAVSGITGQVKRSETLADPQVTRVACEVVRSIVPDAHGLYSVDLREDAAGQPKVNEINPRMAARPSLFERAGVNLALAALHMKLRGSVPEPLRGGTQPGWRMCRQLDLEPAFLPPTSRPGGAA